MPQKRAAKKALRKSVKNHEANLGVTNQIKNAIKKFKKAVENKDTNECQKALEVVYKVLDKAASKHVIHPNKAARKKSRLTHLAGKLTAAKKS